MKYVKKLFPGQRGTKKLVEKYGEHLLCVRYRYDHKNNKRIKSVELIVDVSPISTGNNRTPMNKKMSIKIDLEETYFRKIVKAAGGKWNREAQVWELPYKDVIELGLEQRIVK